PGRAAGGGGNGGACGATDLGRTDPAAGADRAAGGGGRDEPGDRGAAGGEPADGGPPPAEHLHQAGGPVPGGACRAVALRRISWIIAEGPAQLAAANGTSGVPHRNPGEADSWHESWYLSSSLWTV